MVFSFYWTIALDTFTSFHWVYWEMLSSITICHDMWILVILWLRIHRHKMYMWAIMYTWALTLWPLVWCPLISWVFLSIGLRSLARSTRHSLPKGFHLGMGLTASGQDQPVRCLGDPDVVIGDRQGMFRTNVLALQLGWRQWMLYASLEISLVIVTLVAHVGNFLRDPVIIDFLPYLPLALPPLRVSKNPFRMFCFCSHNRHQAFFWVFSQTQFLLLSAVMCFPQHNK